MGTRRSWRSGQMWLGAGLWLAGAGCFGAPVSGDSDDGPGQDLELYSLPLGISTFCRDGTRTEVGLDSETGLGFTAASILEFAEGEKTQQRVALDVDADDPTSIVVEVQSLADGARVFDPEEDIIGHGLRCDAWLEMAVRVTVKTSDGALDAHFDATLFAVHPDVAILYARPDGTDLELLLSPHGVSARVWQDATPEFGDQEPTQRYAAPDCAPSDADFSLALDVEHRGTSVQRMLDRMQLAEAFDVLWSDGTTTSATALSERAAEHGCITVDRFVPSNTELSVAARTDLFTDDGRFHGVLPGTIKADVGTDLTDNQYFWSDGEGVAVGEPEGMGFPEYAGLTGLSLWLSIHLDPDDLVSGELSLRQRPEDFCEPGQTTDGAVPCSDELIVLESATLTGR